VRVHALWRHFVRPSEAANAQFNAPLCDTPIYDGSAGGTVGVKGSQVQILSARLKNTESKCEFDR
jgi:hypothetical protein